MGGEGTVAVVQGRPASGAVELVGVGATGSEPQARRRAHCTRDVRRASTGKGDILPHCDLLLLGLGDVTFEVAVERDTQEGIALEVEDCQCPPGYVGLSCQDCAPGYERSGGGLYLGTCVQKTISTQCSSGAVSCFCSGVTQDCSSSSWYRHTEEVDFSRGGRNIFEVTTSDARSPYSPASRASVGSRELTFSSFGEARGQTLYWKLAEPFTGNKVTAYGGYIKYVFRYSGTGSPNSEPDVILRGNDITLHYIHRDPSRTDQDNTVEITMFEDRWQRVDGQPATREHLLMTLADLDTFLIKMSYVDRTESSSLLRVEMQYANERDSGLARASAVEMCRCPPGYIGTSCEDCAPGYSRSGGGLYLGLCERCECHGHASECDLEYGYCIDCQHNTEGDQCERCKPGFTGDARRGTPNDCQPLAVRPPCHCNNHSPRGCDSYGRCLLCEHNTEGEHCETCKRGFYGRATDGTPYDCTPCPCPGDPPPTLTWGYRTARGPLRGDVVANNGDLSIPSARLSDAGQYICTASNPYGTVDASPVRLDVSPKGAPPQPIVDPSFQTVRVGDPARITCTASGDPPPQIRWGFRVPNGPLRGDVVESNGVLSIPSASMEDAGDENNCYNSDGAASSYIKAELVCTPTGSQLVDRVQWVRLSNSLPNDAKQTDNGILRFSSFEASYAGDYECQGYRGSDLVGSASVRVNARGGGPKADFSRPAGAIVRVSEPAIRVVQEGGSIVLNCEVSEHKDKKVNYEWALLREGTMTRLQSTDSTLTINNANPATDFGVYRCEVETADEGELLGSATVAVIVGHGSQSNAVSSPFDLKAPAQLICPIYSVPGSIIEWTKEGGSLPEKAVQKGNTLEISDFDEEDQGIYTCRVTINRDSVQGYVKASIWVPETIIQVLTEVSQESLNLGETAWFDCKVQGDPSATVTWSKEGSDLLPDNSEVKGNRLLLTSLREDNSGIYKCRAQTKAGPLETRTVLNIGSAKRKRKELRNGEPLTRNHRNLAAHLDAQERSNSVFGTWRRSLCPRNKRRAQTSRFCSSIVVPVRHCETVACFAWNRAVLALVLNVRFGRRVRPWRGSRHPTLSMYNVAAQPAEVALHGGRGQVTTRGLPITRAVGMEARIPCASQSAKGVAGKVKWEKLNGELPHAYRVQLGVLVISKLTRQDAGVYRCTLETAEGLASKTDVNLLVSDFIPSFDGKGFVEVIPLPQKAWQQFEIKLTFKPRSSEGLIFYTEKTSQTEEKGDFVTVGLRNGKVVYRFDLGSGPAEIVSNHPVEVGEWNQIIFKKDDKKGTLTVNDEDENFATAPGTQVGLGLADSVSLGGVEDYAEINTERIGFKKGLDGAISEYVVNGVRVDLGEAVVKTSANVGLEAVCAKRPCLNGGSCIPAYGRTGFKCKCNAGGPLSFSGERCEKPGKMCENEKGRCEAGYCLDKPDGSFNCICPLNRTGVLCSETRDASGFKSVKFNGENSFVAIKRPTSKREFVLELSVKPTTLDDQVIAYVGGDVSGSKSDFLGLALVDGKLRYSYDNGGGIATLSYGESIEVGKVYEIAVQRIGSEGSLRVNGETITAKSSGDAINLATDLFIGGVAPGIEMADQFGDIDGFSGCILAPVKINGVEQNLLRSAIDGGNVDECPTDDEEMPCANGTLVMILASINIYAQPTDLFHNTVIITIAENVVVGQL
uniref:Basement membrane-specific heparan sulfate proteoglycan core protein n=1 Tax=Plectus sambesii TaxID=2011161 RepID=A0A914WHN0_9BILA